jgi:hypothetical protein
MRRKIIIAGMSLLLLLEFVVIFFGTAPANPARVAASTASNADAPGSSQQNQYNLETQWVAANLNGHHYEAAGVVNGVQQSSTESVTSSIDNACSLKVTEETHMHLSTPGFEDLKIKLDCTVDLRSFPRTGVTLEPQPEGEVVPNEWIVDLDDADSVDCIESNNANVEAERNQTFHLFFHSKAEAEQAIDGFQRALIDSCRAQ